MSFLRAFQWYHSHADPIWPDGTFKIQSGWTVPLNHFLEHLMYMTFLSKEKFYLEGSF
jgi:hypothetical protein